MTDAPPKAPNAKTDNSRRRDEEGRPKKPRGPKKVTAAYLERAALHYLSRYGTCQAQLRRVLMKKVARSVKAHGTDGDEGAAQVDALVARLAQEGLVDDQAYAAAKVRSLRRRGASRRVIRGQLTAKGLSRDHIDAALGSDDLSPDDADLMAAQNYVRKRRLGPYRPAERRAEWRERDLAALGRRGFSYEIAVKVIEASPEQEGADELP